MDGLVDSEELCMNSHCGVLMPLYPPSPHLTALHFFAQLFPLFPLPFWFIKTD